MALTPQWLDELRARTTLSTLIGKSVKVTRAGREWKACCPFHNEKTPSFTINDDKGFYHCFGCSAHGDAIRWMTDQRGLSFMDAVKELAASAGMEVPAADPASARRAEEQVSLRDITEASAAWFREQLCGNDGADARNYLTKRGLSQPIIETFGLGFAPDARGRLREVLSKFGDPLSVEAGMLIQPPDDAPANRREPYDRFRGRLMIPIRDVRGRVIAFGGRILGTGDPKYLNSPDTPLFDKGKILYNLDRAAPAARKANRLIVVEGYMDVIALAQAGIDEAVAPLGTALTEDQIALAWRQVQEPYLAFDGDSAGSRAAIRAAERALPILKPGFGLKLSKLPKGMDPDDVVKSTGAAGFEAHLNQAEPLSAFLFREIGEQSDLSGPEGRSAFQSKLIETSDKISDNLVKKQFRGWFMERFYESFGWKSKNRDTIIRSAFETSEEKNGRLFQSIFRSALFGLSQCPHIVESHIEEIQTMNLKSDPLKAWRDSIIEQIISRPDTYEDCIEQFKNQSDNKTYRQFDLSKDLMFPWNRDKSKIALILPKTLSLIAQEVEIKIHLAELDKAMLQDTELDQYDNLHANRLQLWAMRDSVLEQMTTLAGDDSPIELRLAA